ncbi:MAG: NlpC/P60 family protein [Acidimicrobiales bacterium]
MLYVRRRGTIRIASLLVGAALIATTLTPTIAGAGSISATRAEIARLSATLSQQEKTSEITANEYDAAKVKLQQINATITTLDARELAKRSAISVTAKKLAVAVVRAYVLGAAESQILGLFNQNVATADARRVYQDEVIGNLNALEDNYKAQKHSLDTTIAQVNAQRVRAQHQSATIEGLLVANAHNESVTRATLAVVTRTLARQIISYEIAVGVAAARARNVAGEEQAVAAASEVGGQAAANKVLEAIQAATPPLVSGVAAGSAQGMAALRAAESQIGVPYAWGGETPGHGFDCSGLVQWAWAQAGFSIPRTTESQWPALRHVPLGALQPGDLLFYYNLDGDHQVDHVVMYAGSGPWGTSTIIAAAHSGTTVSLAPIFTFGLVGAARP